MADFKKFFSGIFSTGAQSLTEGSIPLLLTRFAIPYMAANLLQALYGAAGQFTDAAGLSAVSIGSQFIFMINSIVIGLSIGDTIMIGRFFGAGRTEEIHDTIGTMLTLFALLSVVITVGLLLFIDPIVWLLGTPEESFEPTRGYVFINVAGLATMFAYNALAAVFRGFGDSTSPLMFVAVACVLNIVGDLALVGIFGMGANGAAIATVFSQGFSAYLAVVYASAHRPADGGAVLADEHFVHLHTRDGEQDGRRRGGRGDRNHWKAQRLHDAAAALLRGRDFCDGRAEHRRGQAEARALDDVLRCSRASLFRSPSASSPSRCSFSSPRA